LAAVIRGHLQAGQRTHDLVADGRFADVVDDDVEHVPDGDAARLVVQPARGQTLIDLRADFGMVGHEPVGLFQVQIARGTRGHELLNLWIDHGQIPSDHRTSGQLVLAEIFGRAAAVPIGERLQLDTEKICHLADGIVIGDGVAFQRTTGIVGVFHGK